MRRYGQELHRFTEYPSQRTRPPHRSSISLSLRVSSPITTTEAVMNWGLPCLLLQCQRASAWSVGKMVNEFDLLLCYYVHRSWGQRATEYPATAIRAARDCRTVPGSSTSACSVCMRRPIASVFLSTSQARGHAVVAASQHASIWARAAPLH